MKQLLIFPAAVVLAFAAVITYAQLTAAPEGNVPAFHPAPPKPGQALPPVLTQPQLAANGVAHPAAIAAYKAAVRSTPVMYQQPCYCYCDRNHGHKSLRSCFEDMHGANCGTCVQEALYTYNMSKKGWSARQIRDGIIRGEWKQIDLTNPPVVK